MKAIHLLAVTAGGKRNQLGSALLDELAAKLARPFQAICRVQPDPLEVNLAFDPTRNQYHSTAILERLEGLAADPHTRLLGVTALDLFVPVLTFVFGEAQLEGPTALVSVHRLREEFYGLPSRDDLLQERLLKEAVHELGHTFGLRHCSDWRCVMASAHGVERVDLKSSDFCPACNQLIAPGSPVPVSR